jgi:hypothetical protein
LTIGSKTLSDANKGKKNTFTTRLLVVRNNAAAMNHESAQPEAIEHRITGKNHLKNQPFATNLPFYIFYLQSIK